MCLANCRGACGEEPLGDIRQGEPNRSSLMNRVTLVMRCSSIGGIPAVQLRDNVCSCTLTQYGWG